MENEKRSRDANKQGRRGSKKEASVYSHNDMDEDQKKTLSFGKHQLGIGLLRHDVQP